MKRALLNLLGKSLSNSCVFRSNNKLALHSIPKLNFISRDRMINNLSEYIINHFEDCIKTKTGEFAIEQKVELLVFKPEQVEDMINTVIKNLPEQDFFRIKQGGKL